MTKKKILSAFEERSIKFSSRWETKYSQKRNNGSQGITDKMLELPDTYMT